MEKYKMINRRLGLAENTQTYQPSLISGRKVTVFSSDRLESDVVPMNIPVSSIAHLNQLIGMPDDGDDSRISYPPPLSELMGQKYLQITQIREFLHALTPDDHKHLKTAMESYLMGNSERVKEYEPLINAVGFPGKIAYFATSEDLEISGEVIVKGEDPVIWNCGRIRLGENASIAAQTPLIIFAGELECNQGRILIHAPDFTQKAYPGQDGNAGADGGERRGVRGTDGTPGFNGQHGLAQPPFSLTVHGNISGNLQIGARGGNGQDGGTGGNGGRGGSGSEPGNGGDGGRGGRGGNGGDPAPVQVICQSLTGTIETLHMHASPGIAGKGGLGGNGKSDGKNGDDGETGLPGASPEITIIRSSL